MEDRKARLAALKARATEAKRNSENSVNPNDENHNDSSNNENFDNNDNAPKALKFRNYTPKDPSLEHDNDDDNNHTPATNDLTSNNIDHHPSKKQKTSSSSMITTTTTPKTELEMALLEAQHDLRSTITPSTTTTSKDSGIDSNLTLTSLAPKKVNWDLKRNIQSKMDKLERRTQRVIVELLRERLEKEAGTMVDDDDDDLD